MLQRVFMTPEALGLTPERHAALVEVLRMLEAGEIEERTRKWNYGLRDRPLKYFSMEVYHCGTVGCIAGWAGQIANDDWFDPETGYCDMPEEDGGWPTELDNLFHWQNEDHTLGSIFLEYVTMAEAAAALRRYLETGKPFGG